MARLLVADIWYDSLPASALLEREYTRILLQWSSALFPTFHMVPFTPVLSYAGVDRIPDLALIDKQYRTWWVVEVERSDHSIHRHIVPQVEVFARATYGAAEADHLVKRAPTLDGPAIRDLMRGQQPRVIVVSDRSDLQLQSAIARYDAIHTVVEIFRSSNNRTILRLNGEYPPIPGDILTVCRPDPTLPRLLIVDSPAAIRDLDSDIQISYKGEVCRWTKIHSNDRVWLLPDRTNPIDLDSGPVNLLHTEDGRFAFQTLSSRTSGVH